MEAITTIMIILVGFALAVFSVIWVWRAIPGIIYQMQNTIGSQTNELEEVRAQMHECHHALMEIQLEQIEWRYGMKRNLDLMRQAKIAPAWMPEWHETRADRRKTDAETAQTIAERFSMDEIKTLGFEIGINPDEYKGETAAVRAAELVALARRTGLSSDLRRRVRESRPTGE